MPNFKTEKRWYSTDEAGVAVEEGSPYARALLTAGHNPITETFAKQHGIPIVKTRAVRPRPEPEPEPVPAGADEAEDKQIAAPAPRRTPRKPVKI